MSHGAGVDMQDGQWNTPLILTCSYAHPAEAAMRSLIKAGCDVNIVGWSNQTLNIVCLHTESLELTIRFNLKQG